MSIINIEIRSHKKWSPIFVLKSAHSNRKQSVYLFFYLLNICTSTIIKAIVMIVTDTRPAKSSIINCNNASTIHITSSLEATHPCFSLFHNILYISVKYKSIIKEQKFVILFIRIIIIFKIFQTKL
mgnify:CR=1 FL=1